MTSGSSKEMSNKRLGMICAGVSVPVPAHLQPPLIIHRWCYFLPALVFTILISPFSWQLVLVYPLCSFNSLWFTETVILFLWLSGLTVQTFLSWNTLRLLHSVCAVQKIYRTIWPLQTQQRTMLSIPIFSLLERDFTSDMISYKVLIYEENPDKMLLYA